MTRRFSVPLAAAVCAAATAWWAYPEPPAVGGQPPAAAPAAKWEYGTLLLRANYRPSWEAGAEVTDGDDWKGLAAALKLPVKGEGANRGALLNALGAQGWELVSHATHSVSGRDRDTYTFKRRVP